MADRIAVMRDGRLVQYAHAGGDPRRPADDFVADFVGADRALKRLSLIRAGSSPRPSGSRPWRWCRCVSVAGSRACDDACSRRSVDAGDSAGRTPIVARATASPTRPATRPDVGARSLRCGDAAAGVGSRTAVDDPMGPRADLDWDWIGRHTDDIASATVAHLELVGDGRGLAVAVAIPIAIRCATARRRTGRAGRATCSTPSRAWRCSRSSSSIVGIGSTPAVIGLAVYALGVLIRNTLTGLREVPPAALEAARGMGMTRRQVLFRVELPLAVPAHPHGHPPRDDRDGRDRDDRRLRRGRRARRAHLQQRHRAQPVPHPDRRRRRRRHPHAPWCSTACCCGVQWLITPWRRRGAHVSLLADTWTAFPANEGWERVIEHVKLSVVPLAIAGAIGLCSASPARRAGRSGASW